MVDIPQLYSWSIIKLNTQGYNISEIIAETGATEEQNKNFITRSERLPEEVSL